MEHQKILNLLNEENDYEFMTKKWNIVNDNPKSNYGVTNEIIYNTEVLKSSLCDYNDAYILLRSDIIIIIIIIIIWHGATKVAFKDCAPFTKCTTKIYETTIDDAENLDLAIPMYNLIEYN